MLGRWKDAVTAFERSLFRYPDFSWAQAYLAVDYMELAHEDATRTEVAEALRLNPGLTVDRIFPCTGLQNRAFPAEVDRFVPVCARWGSSEAYFIAGRHAYCALHNLQLFRLR
jgi:hypothetical protein